MLGGYPRHWCFKECMTDEDCPPETVGCCHFLGGCREGHCIVDPCCGKPGVIYQCWWGACCYAESYSDQCRVPCILRREREEYPLCPTCEEGYACVLPERRCYLCCDSNEECPGDICCYPDPVAQEECGKAGVCLAPCPPGRCKTDEDCPPDQKCENGVCVPRDGDGNGDGNGNGERKESKLPLYLLILLIVAGATMLIAREVIK